jgi:hypothetical protein
MCVKNVCAHSMLVIDLTDKMPLICNAYTF